MIFINKIIFLFLLSGPILSSEINIGSKNFTESYILSEIISQVIEEAGEVSVNRNFGMSGTGVTSAALMSGGIDLYTEYTGTIARSILSNPNIELIDEINAALRDYSISITPSLGFNNTYALAVARSFAEKNNLKTISDLSRMDNLVGGFSHEFLQRDDGLIPLLNAYELELSEYRGFEHSLLYDALVNDDINLMEVYTTDGKIVNFDLTILDDDLSFFPPYEAVIIFRDEIKSKYPETFSSILNTVQDIDEQTMQQMNYLVETYNISFASVAEGFLNNHLDDLNSETERHFYYLSTDFFKVTAEHIYLVLISVFFATLIGVPLGYLAYKFSRVGHIITIVIGVLQTIPALALLCFLLPFFGVGNIPALVALFLYGLLPIVQNTLTGFKSIPRNLIETSNTLSLSRLQKLKKIYFPLALVNILTGIKTTGVICVGMATLAAFIGAGGYGTNIVTGLALNNLEMIMRGALPAALMAVGIHFLFEVIERVFIPKGLIREK